MSTSRGLQIDVEADCGNAPRKAQVRDWIIAIAKGDVDAVCRDFDDGICWDVAGKQRYDGISDVRTYVEKLTEGNVDRLTIRHLLSHGKQVAAEGTSTSSRFAHIITYTGHGRTAKIAKIISYFATDSG